MRKLSSKKKPPDDAHPIATSVDAKATDQARTIVEVLHESQQLLVEFLKIDLQAALTFARVAESSTDPVHIEQGRRNAAQAYDTIWKLLPKVQPGEQNKQWLEFKLKELEQVLERLWKRPDKATLG
jgi:hypothetical protein